MTTHHVRRAGGAARAAAAAQHPPSPARRVGAGATFAETLRAQRDEPARPDARAGEGGAMRALRSAAASLTRGERMVSHVISAARHGKVFSNEELLAIQAGVYKYTQELELASKLVDKATGAVKQTLQSQQ